MMTDPQNSPALSPILIHLLRGVLYRDQHETAWQGLLQLQAQVVDYIKILGLELHMDESEGYAYLKQTPAIEGEGDADALPKLIQRRPLSYPVSLLCTLLRKKLVEADAGGTETRVILTREQIIDLMRVFFPQRPNESLTDNQIESAVNRVIELGFVRPLKADPPVFEIRRIVKALVDADWLAGLDEKLKAYQDYGNASA